MIIDFYIFISMENIIKEEIIVENVINEENLPPDGNDIENPEV